MTGTDNHLWSEYIHDALDISFYLFRCTMHKQILSINTTHKTNFPLEFAQGFSIHVSCFCLKWMQAVNAGIDQIWYHFMNGSA